LTSICVLNTHISRVCLLFTGFFLRGDQIIPRYEPTYSFTNIHKSLLRSLREDRTVELEKRAREYFRVKHVFLLRSGKTCLYTILRAYNRPGKVLMPAYNCADVPEAAVFAGYSPYFLDADISTLNVPWQRFEEAISEDVTAIIAISVLGVPYDVRPIMEITKKKGILLIEDAASAMGSRIDGQLTGTIGDVGVVSFQDTKPLAAKTGGLILTNDDDLAQKISVILQDVETQRRIWKFYFASLFRKLATRRWLYPYTLAVYKAVYGEATYEIVTAPDQPVAEYFRKCSPFSVELLLNQWDAFENNIERRQRIASIYQQGLENHSAFTIPNVQLGIQPAWIQFPLLVRNKQDFYHYMQRHGVDTTWTYRYTCAEEFGQKDCPNAEKIARSIVSLPCYPDLKESEAREVCRIASEYIEGAG